MEGRLVHRLEAGSKVTPRGKKRSVVAKMFSWRCSYGNFFSLSTFVLRKYVFYKLNFKPK